MIAGPRHLAYIGLGSNLEHPTDQVRKALLRLAELPWSRLLCYSSLYRTRPLGPADQPDYINGAALLETGLTPERLLDALQGLEREQGRVRGPERWGPRTLDLDLLLYDDQLIETPRLSVPHRGLHQRAFVLYPLAEIAPDLEIPGRGLVGRLRDACDPLGIERLQ
jgi:2-amino-4-hydroxy-6-hydroxymethyldihydropteridine diphosphokinase